MYNPTLQYTNRQTDIGVDGSSGSLESSDGQLLLHSTQAVKSKKIHVGSGGYDIIDRNEVGNHFLRR